MKHVVTSPGAPQETGVNTLVGTPLYMSPEAIRSTELIDARSDLYAVDAIGYFLLTGRHVFAGSSSMEVLAAHPSRAARRPARLQRRVMPVVLARASTSNVSIMPLS